MTFSTILGVIETLWCSFRFVLEGKIGKEIPESSRLELFKKFLANNFALSDTEGNTSGPLNRGSIADLPLLRTLLVICQKSREPSLWEVMDSSVLLASGSLAALRTFSQRLLACLNFTFDSEDLLFVKTEKVISMNYGSITSRWKPFRWVRLDLIFTMKDLYINPSLNTLTHSLAATEALSLRISSSGTSLKWSRRPFQSARE